MPTLRTRGLDVDTKRYLNRVNGFRRAGGLPDIIMEDAVDIDNFVVGLKDLGVWERSCCWLLRGSHNIGWFSKISDALILPIGGMAIDVARLHSHGDESAMSWLDLGIKQNISTAGGGKIIGIYSNINFQNFQNYSLFGCTTAFQLGTYHLGARSSAGLWTTISGTSVRQVRFRQDTLSSTPIIFDNSSGTTNVWGDGAFLHSSFFLNNGFVSTRTFSSTSWSATNSSYVVPDITRINFGTNNTHLLNYGFLTTSSYFGLIYNHNVTIDSSFYELCKQSIGRNLNLP